MTARSRPSLARRAADYFGMTGRIELLIAALLSALLLLIRFWDIFRYRFDSDESQHLHVVWAWTQGLVQYRDAFDNHMPLFQLLCAPLLGLVGQHANDLFWMRLLMCPLSLLSGWMLYRLGAVVFSRRVGIWGAILVSYYAPYQLCSTEFRPDSLWALLWLLCLFVLMNGRLSVRRSLAAGLMLGLCFGVSMKSTIMLLTLGLAATMALLTVGWRRVGLREKEIAANLAAFLGAAAIVPVAIATFFAAKGIWPQFRYCVFEHNLVSAAPSAKTNLHLLILPATLPILFWLTRNLAAGEMQVGPAFRRAFFFAITGAYPIVLFSFWNHITRQDYLPFSPLVALFLVELLLSRPALLPFGSRWRTPYLTSKRVYFPAPAVAALCLLLLNLGPQLPRRNEARREIALVREVLALAQPSDYVFDRKGETVFHPRSFYYVMEGLTLERLKRGLLVDDVDQRCVETRTCVAVVGGGMPKEDRNFLETNYFQVGPGVRVAGYLLNPKTPAAPDIQFNVAIPAPYEVVASHSSVAGLLDGVPYQGSRFLAPGQHDFRPANPGQLLALVWSQAAERHFTPFSRVALASHHSARAGHAHAWKRIVRGIVHNLA